jgi:hypothetical protein
LGFLSCCVLPFFDPFLQPASLFVHDLLEPLQVLNGPFGRPLHGFDFLDTPDRDSLNKVFSVFDRVRSEIAIAPLALEVNVRQEKAHVWRTADRAKVAGIHRTTEALFRLRVARYTPMPS